MLDLCVCYMCVRGCCCCVHPGVLCACVCVWVSLSLCSKEHGVHVFMLQLRDENHNLLPGIEAGDVGPKMGDHAIDTGTHTHTLLATLTQHAYLHTHNTPYRQHTHSTSTQTLQILLTCLTGYLRLKDVRIPREHLLSKRQHVSADGRYVSQILAHNIHTHTPTYTHSLSLSLSHANFTPLHHTLRDRTQTHRLNQQHRNTTRTHTQPTLTSAAT